MATLYQITNLVLSRGSEQSGFPTMNAAWGVSGSASWGYGGWYDEEWHFNASKNMSSKVTQQSGAGAATGDIVWTRGGEGYHSTAYGCYNRAKYHPLTSGRYLKSVTCKVIHGQSGYGKTSTSGTYTFKAPAKPTFDDVDYDSSTHDVTFTVNAAADNEQYERYDTVVRVLRQDSSNRNNTYKTEKAVINWAASTDSEIEKVYRLAEAGTLPVGQWVKLTCQAYSRGLAGNSATVSKTYVFAQPAQASITKITCSGKSSTDYVTVRLKTNSTSSAPVDSVKLQRLTNQDAMSAAAAGLVDGWEDVSGAVDNGNCIGFTDLVADALPAVKKHTWYRLVTTHGAYTRNSVPVEAKCLYRNKSLQDDDVVKYARCESGADGVSILCRLAWNDDDSNTTKIAWSEYEDAWESNEQPSSCDVTWRDSGGWTDESVTPPVTYGNAATVTIRGLQEATEYYIRARRGLVGGETESWGAWCPAPLYPISTAVPPSDVVLVVPVAVERGSGIDCLWTYSGSEQTAWEVAYLDGTDRKVLASGEGPAGSTVIPASMIEGMDSVKLSVSVTASGVWASSDWMPVSIEDAPTLSMSAAATLTAQPVSLAFTSNDPKAYITAYITSGGVATATPDGHAVQADGDVVWADVVSPVWEAAYSPTSDAAIDSTKTYYTVSNGVYSPVVSPIVENIGSYYEVSAWTATVTPPTLKLYEGAKYTVSAIATDSDTLLSSDAVESDFEVAWAHRAVAPKSTTSIVVDELTAAITPVAPTDGYGTGDAVALTDVVDVYRNTPDGAYLIASDVPFGQAVTDRFAPYSSRFDTNYILCTRTADGDIAWDEYAYDLEHSTLRVDFGGEHVELPYNLSISDGWEKGFELREHLDGTRAGYWNEGATRKASLSTDVVKVESAEQRRLLAALAQHAGPCFVRTPDGCAYPADVEVESYGVTYESQAVPVSLSATEVSITDEFKIAPSDWVGAPTGTTGESS